MPGAATMMAAAITAAATAAAVDSTATANATALADLHRSTECQHAIVRARQKAWHMLVNGGHSCDQAWIIPRLRAVYIENQKAASRSVLALLKGLDDSTHIVWL